MTAAHIDETNEPLPWAVRDKRVHPILIGHCVMLFDVAVILAVGEDFGPGQRSSFEQDPHFQRVHDFQLVRVRQGRHLQILADDAPTCAIMAIAHLQSKSEVAAEALAPFGVRLSQPLAFGDDCLKPFLGEIGGELFGVECNRLRLALHSNEVIALRPEAPLGDSQSPLLSCGSKSCVFPAENI